MKPQLQRVPFEVKPAAERPRPAPPTARGPDDAFARSLAEQRAEVDRSGRQRHDRRRDVDVAGQGTEMVDEPGSRTRPARPDRDDSRVEGPQRSKDLERSSSLRDDSATDRVGERDHHDQPDDGQRDERGDEAPTSPQTTIVSSDEVTEAMVPMTPVVVSSQDLAEAPASVSTASAIPAAPTGDQMISISATSVISASSGEVSLVATMGDPAADAAGSDLADDGGSNRGDAANGSMSSATPGSGATAGAMPPLVSSPIASPVASQQTGDSAPSAMSSELTTVAAPVLEQAAASTGASTSVSDGAAVKVESTPTANPLAAPTSAPAKVEAPAAAATTQLAQPPAPATSPAEQLLQVLRPLRKFADGSHRLSVKLTPHDLGTVTVELSLRAGTLSLHLVAEQSSTGSMLQDQLHMLRKDLEQSGVRTGSFEVGQQAARRDQQSGESGRANRNRQTGRSDTVVDVTDASVVSTATTRTVQSTGGASRLDLRI
jgi:flagellar hook-length control protein FliK